MNDNTNYYISIAIHVKNVISIIISRISVWVCGNSLSNKVLHY